MFFILEFYIAKRLKSLKINFSKEGYLKIGNLLAYIVSKYSYFLNSLRLSFWIVKNTTVPVQVVGREGCCLGKLDITQDLDML